MQEVCRARKPHDRQVRNREIPFPCRRKPSRRDTRALSPEEMVNLIVLGGSWIGGGHTMRIAVLLLVSALYPLAAWGDSSTPDTNDRKLADERSIAVYHGGHPLAVTRTSTRLEGPNQARLSSYVARDLPSLRIEVRSEASSLDGHPVLQHRIELSSSRKLTQDLTVSFPVRALANFDRVLMPLKNGLILASGEAHGDGIARYRCAGTREKHPRDLALPLIICSEGESQTAVLTDPYFSSLFGRGDIRWTYPKEVGFEDPVEGRTIFEIRGTGDLDQAIMLYYRTALNDVPPGPEWTKEIAMIGYDYMSDGGRGWFSDIDTLSALIPMADRRKVALCLHGWYDVVGRYCYNEKTGRLDESWRNRIRGIDLTLADLHHRIGYAKQRGYVVLMYFADGILSSKGLPGFDEDQVLKEGGWSGPDVVGGPYQRNLADACALDFFRNYARALFTEFAPHVDGFVWDETFYIKAGETGTGRHRGYLDRAQMRLVKELASMLHAIAPGKAFFSSDCIGETEYQGESFVDVPPYALLADGCYQDSHNRPDFWSYGIFPNYRNVLWSCNWTALTDFKYTVFGVYAYSTPVAFSNGWGDDRGFSEMSGEERADFIRLFNYRKQFRTRLKGLYALPPYFEFVPARR